jgi:hypothetical protein
MTLTHMPRHTEEIVDKLELKLDDTKLTPTALELRTLTVDTAGATTIVLVLVIVAGPGVATTTLELSVVPFVAA